MPAAHSHRQTKTTEDLLFSHYLRTGQRLSGEAARRFLETKAHEPREPSPAQKSAESVLFSHYLRTGERLSGKAAAEFLERKFNPYHDPDDGRFTFKPGGGSLAPRQRPLSTVSGALDRRISTIGSDVSRAAMANRPQRPAQHAAAAQSPIPPDWARFHPGENLPAWRRKDPAKETAPVTTWRANGFMSRLEVEQRAEHAKWHFYYNWGRGMSTEDAAAWAANIEAESNGDFRKKQNDSDKSRGRGLLQWELGSRADLFKDIMGVHIEKSTLAQQYAFRDWELAHTEKGKKAEIDAVRGAGGKAYVITRRFLRPDPKRAEKFATDRANIAEAIMRRVRP